MKKNIRIQTKVRAVLFVMTCLMLGSFGVTSAFAATGDIPEKGWDRLIGGSKADAFNGIISTTDGGTLAVGSTIDNNRTDTDGYIVKTDKRGTVLWKEKIGGTGQDDLNAITQLSDGTFLVAGVSTSSASGNISDTTSGKEDGLIAKYDANGDKLWDMLVGGSQSDYFNDIIATADGGFLAIGKSNSSADGKISDKNNGFQSSDGYIVKFDADGNIEWDNLYGSPESEAFLSAIQTNDGGFVLAGFAAASINATNTGGEITDVAVAQLLPLDGLLVKFDSTGHMVWNNLYGGTSSEYFYGIKGTPDGGCVVVGETGSKDGDLSTGSSGAIGGQTNALVTKFNSAGVAQWNCAFARGSYLSLKDILQTTDGNFLVAGSVTADPNGFGWSDGFLATINTTGSLMSTKVTGGNRPDGFNAIAFDRDGVFVAAGDSFSSQSGEVLYKTNGGQDGLLVHYGLTEYGVTFQTNGGNTIAPQTVAFGSKSPSQEVPVKAGYTFAGWYLDAAFNAGFPLNAPIVEDTTLYAKWALQVMINPILSSDLTISGNGQPGFLVNLTLPNGTLLKTLVGSNGKWTVDLPKSYTLKGGDKVKATLYDPTKTNEALSSDTKVVVGVVKPPVAVVKPPVTGDFGLAIPIALFFILLSYIIMIGVLRAPKSNR